MSREVAEASQQSEPISQNLERLRGALAEKAEIEAKAAADEWMQMQASKDKARVYSFIGPVMLETSQMCMDSLGQWCREAPDQPIRIVFNSPGGSVMDGMALYDYIQELKNTYGTEINTVALGTAASMAAILMQAGTNRIMGKHAYVLVHEISSESAGTMSAVKDATKFLERLQERCLDILVERSTMSREEIKEKWERRDWWLDSDEALAAGFIDEIQ